LLNAVNEGDAGPHEGEQVRAVEASPSGPRGEVVRVTLRLMAAL
jgi:hypothetical protein